MEMYNFDEIIDRRNSDATKWEALQMRWGRTDLLPLWVADMDFKTPPFIINALKNRLQHEVLGYTAKPQEWYDSITQWYKRRYQWDISSEMICFTAGVVPALAMAIHTFTEKGDKVLIQPPVYYPFSMVIENNGREMVTNPLVVKDGQYYIDFEDFEKKIQGCKLFLFCNPHNPGGRVWTLEELQKIASICHKYGVLVISDEIHCDLTLPGHKHIPFACVSAEAQQNSIVLNAASKAFNIAGLATSYAVIQNPDICQKFRHFVEGNMFADGNVFAFRSVVAAYTEGEAWLGQMLQYVQGNIDFVIQYLKENIPQLGYIVPQASYLVFLDFRPLQLQYNEIVDICVEKAKLALNDGIIYGEEGKGFMRINLACPRSVVKQALDQLKAAITCTEK